MMFHFCWGGAYFFCKIKGVARIFKGVRIFCYTAPAPGSANDLHSNPSCVVSFELRNKRWNIGQTPFANQIMVIRGDHFEPQVSGTSLALYPAKRKKMIKQACSRHD